MTRDDAMKLEEGWELDWLVTAKVLGTRHIDDDCGSRGPLVFRDSEIGCVRMQEVVRPGKFQNEQFSPSTDIQDAMELLMAMDTGWCIWHDGLGSIGVGLRRYDIDEDALADHEAIDQVALALTRAIAMAVL